jgi:hypothetical protein
MFHGLRHLHDQRVAVHEGDGQRRNGGVAAQDGGRKIDDASHEVRSGFVMPARAHGIGARDEVFRRVSLEPAAPQPGAASLIVLVREQHQSGCGPGDLPPVADPDGKAEIAGTFDARDHHDLVFRRDRDVAGLADVLHELAHDGEGGLHQRTHRRLRHGEREQLVGEHVTRAVLGDRDEALEFQHLEHAEEFARRPAEPLGDGGQVERTLLCREQFYDIEAFLERRCAITTDRRCVFRSQDAGRRSFHGHVCSFINEPLGFCSITHAELNTHLKFAFH